ncbi:MAG: C-24(28) sterol reductase, partial [Watsoniomyces obsoletus]
MAYQGAYPSLKAWTMYWTFLLFQAAFYCLMPGVWTKGKPLPHENGLRLDYYCSALPSWWTTIAVALALHFTDTFKLYQIIDEFGPRPTMDKQKWRDTYYRRLAELGDVTFGRIEIAPFRVERFGTAFGLIPSRDEETGDWWVELPPGNSMA